MTLIRHSRLPSLRTALVLAGIACGFLAGVLVATGFNARHFVASPAHAAPAAAVQPAPRAGQLADVLRVLDGDTFEARVNVWPGIDITTKVRLRNIDAPELRSRCQEERAKAEAARQALQIILAEGEVMLVRVSLDKYGGRVLAEAGTRTTPDIGAALVARGLVRPYAGGRRGAWCDGT